VIGLVGGNESRPPNMSCLHVSLPAHHYSVTPHEGVVRPIIGSQCRERKTVTSHNNCFRLVINYHGGVEAGQEEALQQSLAKAGSISPCEGQKWRPAVTLKAEERFTVISHLIELIDQTCEVCAVLRHDRRGIIKFRLRIFIVNSHVLVIPRHHTIPT
jgi:hypothetical protein